MISFVLVLQAILGPHGLGAEQVRFEAGQDSLQPYMEQVRRVGVLDHVVVRRVGDHGVHASVPVRDGHHGLLAETGRRSADAADMGLIGFEPGFHDRGQVPGPSPGPVSSQPDWKMMLASLEKRSAAWTPRQGNPGRLEEWIAAVRATGLPHMHAFTRGPGLGKEAAHAAVTLPYHTGGTEGVNTKTKRIMRRMHGRASFALLRHRIRRAQRPAAASGGGPLAGQSCARR
jgi:Transposase